MDRLASISAFVQVVETGSFSAAAKRLKVAPALVTKRVQCLEERLGIRLLNRTTRKVGLTELGERYYQRCARFLSDFAEAESFARSLQSTPHGTFRINTSVALARILSPIIAAYVEIYPDVSFELIMTDHMVGMVEEHFDLAIRAGVLPDCNSLIRRSLGIGRFALCAAPAYLARAGVPHHPKDLAAHNCLNFAQSRTDRDWRFTGREGEYVVGINGNLRSNSIEALRAATLAGQGICLLPQLVVADDLWAGRLERLLAEYPTPDAIIHALYPAGRHESAQLRTFLDFLVKQLRDTDRDRKRPQGNRANTAQCAVFHPDQQG